jgi:hypothetical protein
MRHVKTDKRMVAMSVLMLLACCEAFGDASIQNRPSARSQILGAWELESRTVRAAGGILLDPVLGTEPLGRLFYEASGHMMLQMMRQGRSQAMSVLSNPKDSNNPRIVLGYDSYFGTFQVNAPAGTITHHVQGSLFPEDLGKDFVRQFKIDGNTFTLSFTSKSADGTDVTRTLRFRRLK